MNTLQKIVILGIASMTFITGCFTNDEYLREYSGRKDQENVILKGTATTRLTYENNDWILFNLYTTKGDAFVVNKGSHPDFQINYLSENGGKELSKAINGKDTLTVFGDIKDSIVQASYVLYDGKLLGVYK